MRSTAERLASSELEGALDELADQAEAADWPDDELTISEHRPVPAAAGVIETAGVRRPPVDVQVLAERCGVLVVQRWFPDELSGLVLEHENGAVIGVNTGHHRHRQRFTIAHELGHHLLDHHGRFHIDVSDGAPPGQDLRVERAANDFAAELLMPRRVVQEAFDRTHHAGVLARAVRCIPDRHGLPPGEPRPSVTTAHRSARPAYSPAAPAAGYLPNSRSTMTWLAPPPPTRRSSRARRQV